MASAEYQGQEYELVPLQFEPVSDGFLAGKLVLQSGNSEEALPVTIPVRPPLQVLYLGDLQRDATKPLEELVGSGFQVRRIDLNDSAAVEESVQECDLVLLDDLAAESVPEVVEKRLVNAVRREGLGLMMSGGRSAFGSGGWHDRPIESLLPVELVQKEEKRDPSTSLVLVIDTSGSMAAFVFSSRRPSHDWR